MTRFISITRAPVQVLCGVTLGLYACSFQDFEYLKEGHAEAGAAAVGQGGDSGSGGSSSGAAGTETAPGGAGGDDDSGQGGEAGGAGAITAGQGGAPAGGASGAAGEAGTSTVDTGGEGGVPTGAGGEGGVGGEAGVVTAGAGGEGPVVTQDTLVNPSFESQLLGWTVDPATAIAARYVYTQQPTGGGMTKDGLYELATWHLTDAYTVSVSQRLTGLEPGTYTFSGWFSTTSTDGAYLFARDCGEPEVRVDIPPLTWEWFEIAIVSFTVSSTSCEVGITVSGDATGASGAQDWLNADMFSFTKDP
jgi:hypothetical protein